MSHLAALGSAFADTALAGLGPMTLADVGANPLGAPLYENLLEAGLVDVWGFEPHAEAFAALQPGPGRHWINAAVGAPGRAAFYSYPASEMSSLYPLSAASIGFLGHFKRHLGTETITEVDLRPLDDIAELPALDCLKIDAQGAELQVIETGRAKLAGAVAVIAEMRFLGLYEGEPAMGALDLELRAQGFTLHKFLHQKARMIGHSQRGAVDVRAIGTQLIDGDVVYIRSLEDRDVYSDAQLAYLALLAADVFESHDLALFCLDRLVERGVIAPASPRHYVRALPARLQA
ncbi:FkbM family methyltransferase [Roseobacteraceae bacterium S113]